jgi:hypothetical protein
MGSEKKNHGEVDFFLKARRVGSSFPEGLPAVLLGHFFFCDACLGFFFFPGFPILYGPKNEMVEKNTTQG